MADTKMMRYDTQKSIFTFPCGLKIDIAVDKLDWIFKLFKLESEFKKLSTVGYAEIPVGSARQLKNYLEKD